MNKRVVSFFMSIVILLSSIVGAFPIKASAAEPTKEVNNIIRIEGANRYKTTVEISKEAFPKGTKQAVIASGEKFSDALVGGNLAAHIDGPILLVRENDIPEEIGKELERLNLENIYIVGGEHSISKTVESALKDYASSVDRYYGDNRYLTSVDVANHMIEDGAVDGVAYASGQNFPDALAGSALLAHLENYTLILTDGKNIPEGAPENENKIVFGGPNSINIAELENARRYGEKDRFLTAIDIADKGFKEYHSAILVDGTNYPDALTAVSLAKKYDAPILLTYPELITEETLEVMKDLDKIIIVGGKNSVSEKVEDQIINSLLPEKPVDPEDTEGPVNPEDTEKPVDPEDTEGPVDPEDTEKPIKSDKTGLAEAIKNAQAMLDKGKIYTPASKKYLKYALINARRINDDVNAGQKEVDEIIKYLEDATKTLVEHDQEQEQGPINPVDKSGVMEAIKKAKAELNDGEKYTSKSKKQLKERLEWAELAKDNIYETEAGIDYIMRQLEKAIDSLVEKADDKTGLVELIKIAEEKLNEREKYIKATIERLEEALDKAIKVNSDSDSTQSDVEGVIWSLEYAIQSLIERADDKTDLVKLIKIAEEKLDKDKDYTEKSKVNLEQALEKAKILYNDSNVRQVEVDDGQRSLEYAIEGLSERANDKTGLVELINISEEKLDKDKDYTERSKVSLEQALEKAKTLYNDSDASKRELNWVLDNLEYALRNLETKSEDKSDLKLAIREAEGRLNNGKKYTRRSIKELKKLLDEANQIFKNPDASQREVNWAKQQVKYYISELKELATDKSGLDEAIKNAEAKIKNDDKYTKRSKDELKDTIYNAKVIKEDLDSSKEEVFRAKDNLKYSIDNLVERATDKSSLQEAIKDAEEKIEGKYTVESIGNLKEQITVAKEIYHNLDSSKREVEDAVQNIYRKIDKLEKIATDKSKLKKTIENANKILKNTEGYTKSSIENLKEQLTRAKEVNENLNVTEREVDDIEWHLNKAIELEKIAEDKKGLKEVINQAESKLNSGKEYTRNSIKDLKEKLNQAKQVNENPDSSQSQVDGAKEFLEHAIVRLEERANNKRKLATSIREAQGKLNEDKIYTFRSKEYLEYILDWSSQVIEDPNAVQKQVDDLNDKLKKAIDNLELLAKDKNGLKNAIEKSEEKIKEDEKYTEDSIENLKYELDQAKEVYENPDASQNKVDEQKNLLENQINLLIEKEESSLSNKINLNLLKIAKSFTDI